MCLASVTAAKADPPPARRLCTWGGTPDDPTGIVTFDPGITNTPSAGPIATHAWGPLEGPGCHGTMIFDDLQLAMHWSVVSYHVSDPSGFFCLL